MLGDVRTTIVRFRVDWPANRPAWRQAGSWRIRRWFIPAAQIDVTEVDQAPISLAEPRQVLGVAFSDDGGPEAFLAPMVDGREPADGEEHVLPRWQAIWRGERVDLRRLAAGSTSRNR